FNGHGQPLFAVGFNADGTQAISGGGDKQVRVWTIADGKEVRKIGGFGNDVFQLEIHPDGQFFSASADKVARLHNFNDGKELKKFAGHSDWVYCVTSNAGTKRLATGSYDGEIRIWNLEDGALVSQFLAAPGLSVEAIKTASP
ncbi:MAG: hypothetical protein KDA65_17970, partial [Planctomycetaceae bacterium]|nr:hypothetical protein [Planctomycetaceae bacterium]